MGFKSLKLSTTTIIAAAILFFIIVGSAFYLTYRLAKKTNQSVRNQQLEQVSTSVAPTTKQVKKITLKKNSSADEEFIEILYDGTINHYKNGKLVKSRRRGFMETQMIFRDYEKVINNGGHFGGYQGYQITIETEQGTIVINPDDEGEGEDIVDNTIDHVDTTLNPTPTPQATIPLATPTPTPLIDLPTPSPDSSPAPNEALIPFNCQDYLKSGQKPLKISNIYCGYLPE